jgi:polysaccharide export outer membrane protein
VTRLPLTGTETVLDAIAAIPGLAAQSDRSLIRVLRPGETLLVDWNGIMLRGDAKTNYLLQAGDRVHVSGSR